MTDKPLPRADPPQPALRAVLVATDVAEMIGFAARAGGVSEATVVANAISALLTNADRPVTNPWVPVPLYGRYAGTVVTAEFIPATQRLIVTSEPVSGQKFKSPSGAARAVVAALNPKRSMPNLNGWTFWRVRETEERLEVYREGLRRPGGRPAVAHRGRSEGASVLGAPGR